MLDLSPGRRPAAPGSAGSRRASRQKPRARRAGRARWAGWLFVAPALAMYGLFVLRPLGLTIQYSLYQWDGIGPSTWAGLSNYTTVFTDPALLAIIGNAFKLIVAFSVVPVLLGLARSEERRVGKECRSRWSP